MSFSLIPQYAFRAITDISPEFLKSKGVKLFMLDLDNTIAPYAEKSPSEKVLRWAADMGRAGVELYIVSNSRRKERVEAFARALGVGYVKAARKPSPGGVMRAMAAKGFRAEEAALAGDQIFTDTLAANRAGVISIAVTPVSAANPLFALRYALETPFRAACKKKPIM